MLPSLLRSHIKSGLNFLSHRNAKIFISYPHRKAKQSAVKVATILHKLGHETDPLVRNELAYYTPPLQHCDIFIPILSKAYEDSKVCVADMSRAFQFEFPIIAVYDDKSYSLQENKKIAPLLVKTRKYLAMYGNDDNFPIALQQAVNAYETRIALGSGLGMLDLIKRQYETQYEDIETLMEELQQKINSNELNEEELEQLKVLREILSLQWQKHQEFMVVQEQMKAKDQFIIKWGKEEWADYHTFCNAYLLENVKVNERLKAYQEQIQRLIHNHDKSTLSTMAGDVKFIKDQLSKIKVEGKVWTEEFCKKARDDALYDIGKAMLLRAGRAGLLGS